MCIRDRALLGSNTDNQLIGHRQPPETAVMIARQSPGCKRCLLYTSDAADDLLCVDLGGRRIIQKKTHILTDNLAYNLLQSTIKS